MLRVQEYRKVLLLFLNGVKHELEDVQPETTLLEFIRSTGLTGSKLGCGEVGGAWWGRRPRPHQFLFAGKRGWSSSLLARPPIPACAV